MKLLTANMTTYGYALTGSALLEPASLVSMMTIMASAITTTLVLGLIAGGTGAATLAAAVGAPVSVQVGVFAVVRPTPPGHGPGSEPASILANTCALPAGICADAGEISSIVVPVPWRLLDALKLLIRMLPATSAPPLAGTATMPMPRTSIFPLSRAGARASSPVPRFSTSTTMTSCASRPPARAHCGAL